MQGCPATPLIEGWGTVTHPSLPVCVLLCYQDEKIESWQIPAGPFLPVFCYQDETIDSWEIPAGHFLPVFGPLRYQDKIEDMAVWKYIWVLLSRPLPSDLSKNILKIGRSMLFPPVLPRNPIYYCRLETTYQNPPHELAAFVTVL